MKFTSTLIIAFTLGLTMPLATDAMADSSATREILQRFADDYRIDPLLRTGTFGVRVGEDDDWHLVSRAAEGDRPASAELVSGLPEAPSWYFKLGTAEILERLDRGDLAPGTAAVKAFSSDFAPLDVEFTDGFAPTEDFVPHMLSILFHFWNRGQPEITRFGDANTRKSHGTDVVVLHYQPGFRSGWFSVKPGDHVNEDPKSRTNPFPSLMVITRGRGIGRFDGQDMELTEGQSVFIPAGMSHEFLNPGDAPMEGVLLMFGDGA